MSRKSKFVYYYYYYYYTDIRQSGIRGADLRRTEKESKERNSLMTFAAVCMHALHGRSPLELVR